MERNELDELKEQTNCRALMDLLGVPRRGNTAQCIFPGNHKNGDKSFSMSIGQHGYRCHVCGVSGDIISLIRAVNNCSFEEAVEYLEWKLEFLTMFPKPEWKFSNNHTPENDETARAEINEGIINTVTPNTELIDTWCTGRMINPEVVREYGCYSLSDLRENISNLSDEEKQVAGFHNGENPWFPLTCNIDGLMIPSYMAGDSIPTAWRLRPYTEQRFKVIASHGSFSNTPLGLGLPMENAFLSPAFHAETVFVVDGEPDFFSVNDVLKELEVEKAGIIGIVNLGSGWDDNWSKQLKNAKKVWVMLHDCEAATGLAKKIAESLVSCLGVQKARQIYGRRLLSENRDANDLHKDGELKPLIDQLMKGTK
jgi:CHC2 zinc finger